jgi:hypothetical protein
MSNKQELNKIFSDILGVNIDLNEDNTGYDKQLFIKIIENWTSAYDLSNELATKYGIAFDGIENLLFDSLENTMVLMHGKNKAEIIHWFVYEGKDENGKPYTLTDNKTETKYVLNNAEELFEFLKEIDDIEDLSIEDGDEYEDDNEE